MFSPLSFPFIRIIDFKILQTATTVMYLCAEGRKCRTQETGRESALTFITGNLQRRQKTNTESGES